MIVWFNSRKAYVQKGFVNQISISLQSPSLNVKVFSHRSINVVFDYGNLHVAKRESNENHYRSHFKM